MRVLIVDDDPSVRQVMTVMLGAAGHEIVAAVEDGHTAITSARAHQPDAVILDVSLPDVEGIAILRILRDIQREVRVIVHSGHDDADLAAELLDAGADAVIVKGGDPQDLIDALA